MSLKSFDNFVSATQQSTQPDTLSSLCVHCMQMHKNRRHPPMHCFQYPAASMRSSTTAFKSSEKLKWHAIRQQEPDDE